jgi:hypothetical protein
MKLLCLIGLIAAASAGVTDYDLTSVFHPTQLGIFPSSPAPSETYVDIIRKSLRGRSEEEDESWKFTEGVTSDDATSSSVVGSTNFLRAYRKNNHPF